MLSPHDLRVDSRDAIPRLTAWLAEAHGVTVRPRTAVPGVTSGRVETRGGTITAEQMVVCLSMPIAATGGYAPEITVCAGDPPEGRRVR